jgi:hypothetical protein
MGIGGRREMDDCHLPVSRHKTSKMFPRQLADIYKTSGILWNPNQSIGLVKNGKGGKLEPMNGLKYKIQSHTTRISLSRKSFIQT